VLHPLVPPVLEWFAMARRPLPWRRHDRTPWGVLVSEVMLQQTPVIRVEPVWSAWHARWPGPQYLAAASTAEVLRAWGRLGYPRRALRLQECARVVVDQHEGVLPTDEATLRSLPGIGTYTAAAVVAFAHGRRSVVVDTNVRRVLARALDGSAQPPPHLGVGELRRADELVPPADAAAAEWSAAVMELGALVCTSRSPRCPLCPIADRCAWLAAGSPPDEHAGRRRAQAWAGTDRQARGRVMALLRDAPATVPAADVAAAWPDDQQLERVLVGLVADGLVERADERADGQGGIDAAPTGYRLPGEQGTT